MPSQRQQLVEERAPYCFIHGVVPADILARNFQFAVHVENSSGMNSSGAREIALRLAQSLRKRQQRFNIDSDIIRSYRREILPDCVNACLAAQATTARDCSETFRRIQI